MASYTSWEDYFWPDASNVLKNRLNIKDNWRLQVAERRLTTYRMYEIVTQTDPPDEFDFDHYCGLHRRIFNDVYDWAGTPRTVPDGAMTKRWRDVVHHSPDDRTAPWVTYRYFPGPQVAGRGATQLMMMDFELNDPKNHAPQRFIPIMATYWAGLDRIHSFREGNTRSQSVLFHQVCRRHGYELDNVALFERREEFIGARFHGHATGQYGRFISLLLETVRERESEQLTERELQWAESLRETSQRSSGPDGLTL